MKYAPRKLDGFDTGCRALPGHEHGRLTVCPDCGSYVCSPHAGSHGCAFWQRLDGPVVVTKKRRAA